MVASIGIVSQRSTAVVDNLLWFFTESITAVLNWSERGASRCARFQSVDAADELADGEELR